MPVWIDMMVSKRWQNVYFKVNMNADKNKKSMSQALYHMPVQEAQGMNHSLKGG